MNTLLDAERIHLELLEKWRAAMNLIGPGPAEHHFMDARGAVASLGARGRWADLGSGAGFPGIALAIHNPEAQVLLVESRERRVGFLKQVVRATGLRTWRSSMDGPRRSMDPSMASSVAAIVPSPTTYPTQSACSVQRVRRYR